MKEADEETKAVTQTDRKTYGKKVDFAEWEENKETKSGHTRKKVGQSWWTQTINTNKRVTEIGLQSDSPDVELSTFHRDFDRAPHAIQTSITNRKSHFNSFPYLLLRL